jgi:hypothetical protein
MLREHDSEAFQRNTIFIGRAVIVGHKLGNSDPFFWKETGILRAKYSICFSSFLAFALRMSYSLDSRIRRARGYSQKRKKTQF